jgi:predicted RecA/RadA family phage recombinase
MPQATFVHEGGTVDYTPAADTAAGDVVLQGDLVGVANLDIKAGRLGALAVTGVFDMAKQAALAIAVGVFVYWDNAAKVVTTMAGGNKLLGKAIRAAAAADATVRVRLIQ